MINRRQQNAMMMLEKHHHAEMYEFGKYRVRSQHDPNKWYNVYSSTFGLKCTYPDHLFKNSDCKHIHVIKTRIMKNSFSKKFRIMNRDDLKVCKYCDSGNLTKFGFRKTKYGKQQMLKCLDCQKRFTTNYGFESMRYDDTIITGALQMYFSGMSVRKIADHYDILGIDVCYTTIYRWIEKYSKTISEYLKGVTPRLSTWFRADEVWVNVKGKQNYLFASICDDTRFFIAKDMADNKFQHNADHLLEMTKQVAGNRSPKHFITDGLPAYMKSSKKIFGKDTLHTRHIHLKGDKQNNKMERFNGSFRDREQAFRGLKKQDSSIIDGYYIYYNFTRKHLALDGLTPSESAGIIIDGKNKWKILIQNASLNKY